MTLPASARKPPGSVLENLAKRLLHNRVGTKHGKLVEQAARSEVIGTTAASQAQCFPASWTAVFQNPALWADLRDTLISEPDESAHAGVSSEPRRGLIQFRSSKK